MGLQMGPETSPVEEPMTPQWSDCHRPLPGRQVEGDVSSRDMLAMTLLAFSQ